MYDLSIMASYWTKLSFCCFSTKYRILDIWETVVFVWKFCSW